MRIVFIGSVLFSKYMLETILASRKECQVVGVITKEKSSFNSDHFNLAPLAVENNIPYKYVKDINHPNIIKFHETYIDYRYVHIVMELCEGGELFEKIVEMHRFSES